MITSEVSSSLRMTNTRKEQNKWIKEEMHKHKVSIKHIGTNLMIVDPLTKGLPPKTFISHMLKGWYYG